MNINVRNKKIAINRWKKRLSEEKNRINNTKEGLENKAIICGFLAGDGSVQIRKYKEFFNYEIKCFPDDELMLETYCKAVEYVYGKKPWIRKIDNVFHARLTSKTVVEDIKNCADFGLYSWSTPKKLFMTSENKKLWLKAFFSAEAYVGPKTIKIQTVNKNGMKEISKLLNDFDIQHKAYEYQPKNNNYSKVFMIFINKKIDRKRFQETIGFFHSKKTDKLKEYL